MGSRLYYRATDINMFAVEKVSLNIILKELNETGWTTETRYEMVEKQDESRPSPTAAVW